MIVNRNIPAYLTPDDLAKAAEGDIDADAVRADLTKAGITLSDSDFAGLLTEAIQHATRIAARAESAEQLDEIEVPRLELPAIADGVDLGSLYELAEALAQQGVQMSTTPPALDMAVDPARHVATASWCVAAQAVSARRRPPRRWRCAPPSTAARSWC